MTMSTSRGMAPSPFFHPIHNEDPTAGPFDIMTDPGHQLSDSDEYTDSSGERFRGRSASLGVEVGL